MMVVHAAIPVRPKVSSSGVGASCLLKNTVVAFFNVAKFGAKLLTARKITTYVVILASLPCDVTAS